MTVNTVIYDFIAENFADHCIYSHGDDFLDYVPIKIASIFPLNRIFQFKFASSLMYANFTVFDFDEPNQDQGWNQFQNIITSVCPNLKGILIDGMTSEEDIYKQIYEKENEKIWKNRISFLKLNQIKILNKDIYQNFDLESQIAIEFNVNWYFRFTDY
jgi:hypothetical protein